MKLNVIVCIIIIAVIALSGLVFLIANDPDVEQYRHDLKGRAPAEVIQKLGTPYWDSRRDYPEREDFVFGYSWRLGRGITVHFKNGIVTDVTSANK